VNRVRFPTRERFRDGKVAVEAISLRVAFRPSDHQLSVRILVTEQDPDLTILLVADVLDQGFEAGEDLLRFLFQM